MGGYFIATQDNIDTILEEGLRPRQHGGRYTYLYPEHESIQDVISIWLSKENCINKEAYILEVNIDDHEDKILHLGWIMILQRSIPPEDIEIFYQENQEG